MNPLTALVRAWGDRQWFLRLGQRIVPVDLAVQRRTGGRISMLRLLGLPALMLTTTGRRSGQARSVPLMYVPWGGHFAVVGSNWGKARHPAWSVNLLAHPQARVAVRGREFPVQARLVRGEEREHLWNEITEVWPAYATYAERAGDREIRVFLLTRT